MILSKSSNESLLLFFCQLLSLAIAVEDLKVKSPLLKTFFGSSMRVPAVRVKGENPAEKEILLS